MARVARKPGTPLDDLAWNAPLDDALRGSILDALGEAVVATDLDGRIVYWNEAATRFYGWRADEVMGSQVLDLAPVGVTDVEARAILMRLRQGEPWSGETMVQHRDGQLLPALVTHSPLRNPDGKVVGVVGVSRDISTQREAEATARDAEERLEMVRRAAATVIWEWELSSQAVRWSAALAEAFGHDPDAVEPTMDWRHDRVHPEDVGRVADSFDRFVRERQRFWAEEYRFMRADGGYATVYDRAHMAHDADGEPVRVVGTMLDLTERRRLHEEQRFLAQASMILDLSLDYESTLPTIARLGVNGVADYAIVAVTGADGSPEFVTSAHADPRLQPLVEEVADHMRGGPAVGSVLERVLRDGEAALIRRVPETLHTVAGGEERLAELVRQLGPRSSMYVPLTARQKTLGYLILTSTSDDRLFDDADLRIAEELGRRIGLTIDHARLFHSAELANQSKSDFLAVVSHELRTPLTAVLGYADLLLDQITGPLNDTQQRQIGRIRAGSDRLLRMIEGILIYARLETGRERARSEQTDLHALVRHVEEIIRPGVEEKGVEFRISAGALPAATRTDPEMMVQILLALLTNALKFTDKGAVELHGSQVDGQLRFDVSDSGRGIAPEHLPHVFNPFWQAEQPATRRAGGAGLGLSVARRLARLMGGDVLVVRTAPGGTTFRFQIPARG